MFEKVSMYHLDKIADRVAGAMTDLVYSYQENPNINIKVTIDNGTFTIISESSYRFLAAEVFEIIEKITGHNDIKLNLTCYPPSQFCILNTKEVKCGNTGLYRATPTSLEQTRLKDVVKYFSNNYTTPGEYLANESKIIACQSMATYDKLYGYLKDKYTDIVINPFGTGWASTIKSDFGCSNNRVNSDIGSIGKGLHGKDLGQADLTVAIYTWLKAQESGHPEEVFCSVGDTIVDGKFYTEIVEQVRTYIKNLGGFEALAEWGLV